MRISSQNTRTTPFLQNKILYLLSQGLPDKHVYAAASGKPGALTEFPAVPPQTPVLNGEIDARPHAFTI